MMDDQNASLLSTTWWPSFKTCVEALSHEQLPELGRFYATHAEFRDPFHTVFGREAILRSYAAMFRGLHAPRFESLALATSPSEARVAVRWVFCFRLKAHTAAIEIPGTSWLTLNQAQEIVLHEDHWDASTLLAAFPVVGGLTRLTKKHIAKQAQSL
jgi:hypothetical protein